MKRNFKMSLSAGVSALCMTAGVAAADIVQADDVIVDGSLCVGIDCVNGESFGFDTIRLKENNLRIHFQDTSASASFPTADWRIVVNDSANGGQNKFAIEDSGAGREPFTIEAGARANSLYVDSTGNIGIGTGSPLTDLHVKDGDTPTLRLEQDGSSGFGAQTWDLAGNETNFFIRDASNGSTLPFRIQPSAPSSSIYIADDGDIGFGTTNPGNELHIVDSGNVGILLDSTDVASGDLRLSFSVGSGAGATDEFRVVFTGTGAPSMAVNSDGDMTLMGSLITTGGGGACTLADPCDKVFDPSVYQVPSIEEHAAAMWENKHLPAVGPTGPDMPINMTEKMLRMLNELEHAHIYIEQLNERVSMLETQTSVQQ